MWSISSPQYKILPQSPSLLCAVRRTCAHGSLGSEEVAVALSLHPRKTNPGQKLLGWRSGRGTEAAQKEEWQRDRSCWDGGVAVDLGFQQDIGKSRPNRFRGWATPQTEAGPLLLWVLMGYSHSILAWKGWGMSHCIESCLFLMDHLRLSFPMAPFRCCASPWRTIIPFSLPPPVCHLRGGTCTAPWHPGVPPTGCIVPQPYKIRWSKLAWVFFSLWFSPSTKELFLSSLLFTWWQPWWVYRVRWALSVCSDATGR